MVPQFKAATVSPNLMSVMVRACLLFDNMWLQAYLQVKAESIEVWYEASSKYSSQRNSELSYEACSVTNATK